MFIKRIEFEKFSNFAILIRHMPKIIFGMSWDQFYEAGIDHLHFNFCVIPTLVVTFEFIQIEK